MIVLGINHFFKMLVIIYKNKHFITQQLRMFFLLIKANSIIMFKSGFSYVHCSEATGEASSIHHHVWRRHGDERDAWTAGWQEGGVAMTTSAPLAFAFSHPSYTHEPCLSTVKEHDQGFNFERLNNIHELSL